MYRLPLMQNHMIIGFQVICNPADHRQIATVVSEVKVDYDVSVLETVADKGYECPEDYADVKVRGIVPKSIKCDGSSTNQLLFYYTKQS